MNYKQIEKKVTAMKRGLRPPPLDGPILLRLTAGRRADMELGDRIVEDYYFDADGEVLISKERISADPSDQGNDFPDGTWDRAYWEANPPVYEFLTWVTARRPHSIAPKGEPAPMQAVIHSDPQTERNVL
jgi:hypothetical protein